MEVARSCVFAPPQTTKPMGCAAPDRASYLMKTRQTKTSLTVVHAFGRECIGLLVIARSSRCFAGQKAVLYAHRWRGPGHRSQEHFLSDVGPGLCPSFTVLASAELDNAPAYESSHNCAFAPALSRARSQQGSCTRWCTWTLPFTDASATASANAVAVASEIS